MAAVSPDQTLQTESEKRRPAAFAAFGAATLVAAGVVIAQLARDIPARSVLASLERIGDGGTVIGGTPSLRLIGFEAFKDDVIVQVLSGVLPGLSAALSAIALMFVARATRARLTTKSNLALYAPAVGGVTLLVGSVMVTVASVAFANQVTGTDGTVAAVVDIERPGPLLAGIFLNLFGGLVMGLAYVLVSLNAMKAGLLTRFMGIIGAFVGVVVAIPTSATPIMQAFWLVALGFLLLGVWPGGKVPPAWSTGRAEAWPTPAQEREAKLARRGGGRAPAPPKPEAVEERAASGKPHPSSKKKRKRRS